MTRRNVKRVDYKNVKPVNLISSDESSNDESDDDFVSSLTPPKKKTKSMTEKKDVFLDKTSTTKKKDASLDKTSTRKKKDVSLDKTSTTKKKDVSLDKTKNTANDILKADTAKRKTRTSNADICLEQDLMTAIEISQNASINSSVNSSIKYTDDNESDFENDNDIKKNSNKNSIAKIPNGGKENLSVKEEVKLSSHSNKNTSIRSTESKKTLISDVIKPLEEKTTKLSTATQENLSTDSKIKCAINISNTPITVNKNKLVTSMTNKHEITNKIITPGKLRLGLSRNRKVTKPLHPNITIK